jgi:hypothetical protein
MAEERWTGKDSEGRGRGHIEIISRHLLKDTEKNQEEHLSE